MDDILKSIKAFLYDRASSPLLGAFAISFFVWNYRVVMVIFSNLEVAKKFSLMDELLQTTFWGFQSWFSPITTKLINMLGMPLAIAAFYLVLYPLAAIPVYRMSLHFQGKYMEWKQKADNARLLSAAESAEMFKKMGELEERYTEDIDHYRKQVTSLSEQIAELEKAAPPDLSQYTDEELRKFAGILDAERVDELIRNILIHGSFNLTYNPSNGKSKPITFNDDGTVGEGRNDNESSWEIDDGELLILTSDGKLHNRFAYQPDSDKFIAVEDTNAIALPDQFITRLDQ